MSAKSKIVLPEEPLPYTAAEAELATQQLRVDFLVSNLAVGRALRDMRDRKAHKALGYSSWSVFVEDRLSMSRQRSYQLMQCADLVDDVSRELSTPVVIPERLARYVRRDLWAITDDARSLMAKGATGQEAFDQAVERHRSADTEALPITPSDAQFEAAEPVLEGVVVQKGVMPEDLTELPFTGKVELLIAATNELTRGELQMLLRAVHEQLASFPDAQRRRPA